MKYLLILLFLFSTQGFSKSPEGYGLICKGIKKGAIKGYIFGRDKLTELFVSHYDLEGDFRLNKNQHEYRFNEDFIFYKTIMSNIKINRKTLVATTEITVDTNFLEGADLKSKCKAYKAKIVNEKMQKQKIKEEKEYIKSIGKNKI